LYYTPNLLFDDSAKPLNVFQQLNGNKVNLYIANPRNVPGLTRVSSVDTLGGTCDVDDCIYKLSQKDVEFLNIPIEYSATGGKQGLGQCTATFGTNILNKPGWCPWAQHSERCCSDANGLTGQVCKEGQTCYGNMCTSCVDANCNGYGKCSRTVADTCVCDHGHDPQSQCQNCLPGLTVKTINGYNYCVTGDVQSFNYWNLDQGSYSSGWAVLTTDDNKYINGGHDGRNVVVSFNANLISDGIKKIIFEPTGDINVLTQYQLRQFPGDILVSVFGNSNTISTIDVTNDLIYSGFNYYLEVYVSDACKVKFNVYFSK
jgi:hypothetical protein